MGIPKVSDVEALSDTQRRRLTGLISPLFLPKGVLIIFIWLPVQPPDPVFGGSTYLKTRVRSEYPPFQDILPRMGVACNIGRCAVRLGRRYQR